MSASPAVLTFALLSIQPWSPGCAAVSVSAVGEAAVEPAAVTVARDYLLDRLHGQRPDVERFELTATGEALHGAAQVAAAVIASGQDHASLLSRHMRVWVRVTEADGRARVVPVWFGAPSAADFVLQEVDVAPLAAVPAAVGDGLAGQRTRHSLSRGHVLLRPDLEPQPQIMNGQTVDVTVRQGAIAIRTSAVALGEARTGEAVRLRNPDSRGDYTAQVTGQGEAEVNR
jgi:flagella basal body P-ring formation protein FlgA